MSMLCEIFAAWWIWPYSRTEPALLRVVFQGISAVSSSKAMLKGWIPQLR